MMNKLLTLILLAVLSGMFASDAVLAQRRSTQDSRGSTATVTEGPLIDYTLGKKWVYQRSSPGTETSEQVTSTVVGIHLFNGERWVMLDEFGMAIWSRVAQNGLHDALVEQDEETELLKKKGSHLFFKYPTKVGDKIDTSYPDERNEGLRSVVKTTAVDREVETPAGKFKCVVYELWQTDSNSGDGEELSLRFFLCPGVGVVRMEESAAFNDSEEEAVVELLKIETPRNRR